MYILLSKDRPEFISAIFSKRESLDEFKSHFHEAGINNVTQLDIDRTYPFYITEGSAGFSYLSEVDVKLLINGYMEDMPNRDEGWCYANLYRVSDDFIPRIPGKDCMGLLPHHHIDNLVLGKIINQGFDAIWN